MINDFPTPEEIFDDFKDFATKFELIRNNKIIAEVFGFLEDNDTIRIDSKIKIYPKDQLYYRAENQMYYVKAVKADIFANEKYGSIVTYVENPELLDEKKTRETPHINIGSIHGNAIIGSGDNAKIIANNNIDSSLEKLKSLILSKNDDVKSQEELLSLLEKISTDKKSLNKGLLSKFSDLISKHSDIAIALGNWVVEWLIHKGK